MHVKERLRRAAPWLLTSGGGAGGAGTLGWGIWRIRLWRTRLDQLTDAPEYADEQTRGEWTGFTRQWWQSLPWRGMLVGACTILILVLVVRLIAMIPMANPDNPFDRDPQRLFSDRDREWIRDLTGDRCERRRLFGLMRCRHRGEQMDHWYPWAKGGATSRHNIAWLCAKCNNRKTDRVPTIWATRALTRARMRYFPARWRAWARPDGRIDDTNDTIKETDHATA